MEPTSDDHAAPHPEPEPHPEPHPEPEPHPLLPMLLDAAEGRFPPVDGRAVVLPPLRPDQQAVVSFTGHAVLATSLPPSELADLALDGFGAALHPAVLLRLAGPGGVVGVIDLVLVARGTGGGGGDELLPRRADLDEHPRVRYARTLRRSVRVHGDDRGLVTLAEGLAGRLEMSVEVGEGQPPGTGRALIRAGLSLVPRGRCVFAAVSPGNARSLRAFLAEGFTPLGSEVVIHQPPAHPPPTGPGGAAA